MSIKEYIIPVLQIMFFILIVMPILWLGVGLISMIEIEIILQLLK